MKKRSEPLLNPRTHRHTEMGTQTPRCGNQRRSRRRSCFCAREDSCCTPYDGHQIRHCTPHTVPFCESAVEAYPGSVHGFPPLTKLRRGHPWFHSPLSAKQAREKKLDARSRHSNHPTPHCKLRAHYHFPNLISHSFSVSMQSTNRL